MNQKTDSRILLTAFRNTSAELLIKGVKQYKTLLLPNDKVRDSVMLIEAITEKQFDYVFCVGQRPNIKDKVHIETIARDGEFRIGTGFDCERLAWLFNEKGIVAKRSHNAGRSYCNQLYLNGLRYISEKSLDVKMVFVHIPFQKNISDFDNLRRQFLDVMKEF